VLLLFIFAYSITVGFLLGGRLSNLVNLRIEGEIPILLAVLIQSILRGVGGELGLSVGVVVTAWVVVTTAMAVFAWLNRASFGFILISLGAVANALVVACNGGMPVSERALAASGLESILERLVSHVDFYVLASEETWAPWLGDVLPLPLWGQSAVLSLGDVLMFVGIAVFIIMSMRVVDAPPQHMNREL